MRLGRLLVLALCLGALAACVKKKGGASPAPPPAPPAPDPGAADAGPDGAAEGPAPDEPEDPTRVRLSGRLAPPPPASTATEPATAASLVDDGGAAATAAGEGERFVLECATLEGRPTRCSGELAPPDYAFALACGGYAGLPFACVLRDATGLVVAPVVLGEAHTLVVGHGGVALDVELLEGRRLAVATIDAAASDALGAKPLEELAPTAMVDLSGVWELRRAWCGRKTPCDEPPGDDPAAAPPPRREPDQTVYLRHDLAAGTLELWRSEADHAACHDEAGRVALRIFPPGDGAAVTLEDKLADVDQYLAALATPFGGAVAARVDAVAGTRADAAGFAEGSSERRSFVVRQTLAAWTALSETARYYAADFYVVFDAEGQPTARTFCEVEKGFYAAGAELPPHLEALCGDGAGLTDEQIVALLERAQAALAKSCVPWVGVVEDWTGNDGSAGFVVAMRSYCASPDGLCLDDAGVYKGELPWREARLGVGPSHAGRFTFSSFAVGTWSLVGKKQTQACAAARFAGFGGILAADGSLDAVRTQVRSERCAVAQPRAPQARPLDATAAALDPDAFGGTDFGELAPLSEWFSVRGKWTRVED